MRKLLFYLIPIMLFIFSCSNSGKSDSSSLITTLDELNDSDSVIGILTGSGFDEHANNHFPLASTEYYDNYADMAYLVADNRINAFITDEPVARYIVSEFPAVIPLDEKLGESDYGFAFATTNRGDELKIQMNEFLQKLKMDGTLEEIDSIWFSSDEEKKVIDKSGLSGENGTLQFGTSPENAPFVYLANEDIVGYEIDILYRFLREYGYDVEISIVDYDALVTGLQNRFDFIGGCITIVNESLENIIFSEPSYEGGVVAVVKSGYVDESSFLDTLKTSFRRTFIEESRYLLILQGIGATLEISLLSTFFGTILGFLLCLLRMSKKRWINTLIDIYSTILRGTPLLVFLMILYYIIFAHSKISNIGVASITFAISFASTVCEMMYSALSSINKGQREAALTIGFTEKRTFFKILFPQAARIFLPSYKAEFISLVNSTSIVGYIAVQDLTKMGDIIRDRTDEAFFPLISTALIYFIISYLLSLFIGALQLKSEPKRRKRGVKGVKM